ncbi:hypothetical protein A2957_01980 [Candidatus Roizmanbacteria bacterium RIFCSPLOWO2_01_FULL_38_11]|uniref:PEP-utilising enzyme mobile domain-containing protein n=1 Tax=Candidatus Roizmanbacteria bacterium RIFCSPLOWO2_01_FULL_38_11 TaxID=1802060 RepID=A0A1F7IM39_9BACT|nr:MAG: hypothetical protein A2957_01980 [Candidatus Roizmanbacteria bacterium RIFCSPLOWO2_01_FULL_38_11]
MKLNKRDYILSFIARGVSVFVTDIHVDVYKKLEVLFLIDNGTFKQYFTRKAYESALDRGLDFYSDENAFENYKKALSQHCNNFENFFAKEIRNEDRIMKSTVRTFFKYTIKLCKDYTYMNVEFTDKAFAEQDDNPIIKMNLLEAAKFKDWVRSYMNKVLFESDGYASELFLVLGRQFKLQPYVLHNLTQREILNLYDGELSDIDKTSQRQKGLVVNYDRSHFHEGKNAESIIKMFRDDISNTHTVSGKVACLGKATGPVKIINVDYTDLSLLNKEIEKMDRGDILIAETTAPELIVACQKAAAIVTDIGGLLSHAAIVSREFGIPCVVGTENATKIFKNGDIVEVDAVKGIVKRLQIPYGMGGRTRFKPK